MADRPKTAAEHGIMVGSPPPPDKRITHQNWDSPPFNRWSFQHVREVLPTVNVSRGNGPISTLPNVEQDFDDLPVVHSRDGRQTTLMGVLENTYADGFIAIHKGRVVYERYLNDMTPTTLHLSQSVAKSVVGTVAGILIDRGVIDPRAPLADIIPELAESGYADAQSHQLMDMRSGVRFGEEYTDPDSDIAQIDVAGGWKPYRDGMPLSVLDIPPSLPKEREHGGHFQYRSIETDTMAWVMERTTGKRLADLVSEELWRPMGAEHDACFTVDRGGYALADGGFNATLRDYARVGLLYLNGGKVDDRQLVPAEHVRATRQDGDVAAFQQCPYAEYFPRGAYKNQFWVRDVDREQIMARGVFGQMIYMDPGNDLVIAKLSTWPDFVNVELTLDTLDAVDALTAALNGG
ncbi:MAG: serine hydrolase [Rhodospirillales bacterium]|nr:serine hydrolase [Rhodospirillales bacterium]